MATKYFFLGVGDTAGLGEGTSQLAIATQALLNNEIMPFRKSMEVPENYTSIESVKLFFVNPNGVTGDVYLKFASAHISKVAGSVPTEDSDSYTAYPITIADDASSYITIPAAAYSALIAMAAGDQLFLAVFRKASDALDTYEADFEVAGFGVTFSVLPSTDVSISGLYCTQTEMERRISKATLAALTSDTMNDTEPNATVVTELIIKACNKIDTKLGYVYTVPFTSIPKLIKDMAIDFACYMAFQRRPVNVAVPKDWEKIDKDWNDVLDKLAAEEMKLDAGTVIATEDGEVVAPTRILDFNNTDSCVSMY